MAPKRSRRKGAFKSRAKQAVKNDHWAEDPVSETFTRKWTPTSAAEAVEEMTPVAMYDGKTKDSLKMELDQKIVVTDKQHAKITAELHQTMENVKLEVKNDVARSAMSLASIVAGSSSGGLGGAEYGGIGEHGHWASLR